MGYPSCIKLSFLHGLLSSPEAWSSTRVVWGFFWEVSKARQDKPQPSLHTLLASTPKIPFNVTSGIALLSEEEAAGQASPQNQALPRGCKMEVWAPCLQGPGFNPSPQASKAAGSAPKKAETFFFFFFLLILSCWTPAEPPPQGFRIYGGAPVHHPQGHI